MIKKIRAKLSDTKNKIGKTNWSILKKGDTENKIAQSKNNATRKFKR